ncbi:MULTISPECIES: hypothetical protein [unclassified Pseudomonas]|uniref:hypothetical protein n=1 Tax=unclassified Pseudomonas TaxID=196821 RepID=UPI00244B0981|nr:MULTISPECIES: hypothetical protein [unclassified Pseudomonas]MDG9922488.1 hypothetical protein [Pseudomonas sp. GD04045]MDH0034314.1 hypothetical protein [Pseudomonas sp. GD04019]
MVPVAPIKASPFTRSRLFILRSLALVLILFLANQAFEAYQDGVMRLGTRRFSIMLSGGDIWAGYLFLSTCAAVSMFLFFCNHAFTHSYKRLAPWIGGGWFASLVLCWVLHL